jgi:two-component system, OmpR family, response regulator MprA
MRILLVEDDPDLSRQLKMALADAGYAVDHAPDGEEAQFLGETEPYDAVILDLGLPKVDGVSVLERWRRENMATPVLILTARGAWSEKVAGFDAGADDYLTKPFALEELLARLRALLRRVSPEEGDPDEHLSFSDLSMDLASREVRRGDRLMELTRTEFTLLELFLRRPRRVLERSFILEEVWGFDFPTTANSLEVYVGYLRRKTEAEDEPRLIHTVRGVGYVLRESA